MGRVGHYSSLSSVAQVGSVFGQLSVIFRVVIGRQHPVKGVIGVSDPGVALVVL
jgi:hypothetical protein